MKAYFIGLFCFTLGFLVKGWIAPEPTEYEYEEEVIAEAPALPAVQNCPVPEKAQPEPIIQKTASHIEKKETPIVKPAEKKNLALAKKLDRNLFDQEFQKIEQSFDERLQSELSRPLPTGVIESQRRLPDGSVRMKESLGNGSEVVRVINRHGITESESLVTSEGKFQRRFYYPNGELREVSMGNWSEDTRDAEVMYDPDGNILQKALKNADGDLLSIDYDEKGQAIGKYRNTKDGHSFKIWEQPEEESMVQ